MIGALKKRPPKNDLLESLAMARSSSFHNRVLWLLPGKYAELEQRARTSFLLKTEGLMEHQLLLLTSRWPLRRKVSSLLHCFWQHLTA